MGGHARRLDPKVKVRNVLARLDAELIALLIEEAIDMLDVANDDCDLEDSETGSCTVDARGREIWDMSFVRTDDDEEEDPSGGDINDEPEGECVHLLKPFYALDQSERPINYDDAERAHILSTIAAGTGR
jgi:hypothetical protein